MLIWSEATCIKLALSIDKGLSPESKIIDTMNKSLDVFNNNDIDIFIRIAVFHYLFGYIHPFYDGNGRTSRFISSYLLLRQLNPLIGYRLSYTVKENISKYYKDFEVCNAPHNKAELSPFVEMFFDIVEKSLQQLLETLEEKKHKWEYYCQRIGSLPAADKNDMSHLYGLLIQAALFSNIGISREELLTQLQLSENTLRSRLRLIPDTLFMRTVRKAGSIIFLILMRLINFLMCNNVFAASKAAIRLYSYCLKTTHRQKVQCILLWYGRECAR